MTTAKYATGADVAVSGTQLTNDFCGKMNDRQAKIWELICNSLDKTEWKPKILFLTDRDPGVPWNGREGEILEEHHWSTWTNINEKGEDDDNNEGCTEKV